MVSDSLRSLDNQIQVLRKELDLLQDAGLISFKMCTTVAIVALALGEFDASAMSIIRLSVRCSISCFVGILSLALLLALLLPRLLARLRLWTSPLL